MTRVIAKARPILFRLLLGLVFILPFVVYAPALTERYGFRDDYSTLRESQDSLRTTFVFCASHGRPLYGLCLGWLSQLVGTVDNLWVLRGVGIALLGAAAAMLAWTLHRRIGVSAEVSAGLGFLAALLPSAQVRVAWAICGPHVIGAILGLAAFGLADRAEGRRVWAMAGALLLVLLGAFFYQSDVLVYLIPVVASGVFRAARHDWRWALRHGLVLFCGLALAFVCTKLLFAWGVFPASKRVALETAPFTKLGWYLQNNVQQAWGLFVLRDVAARNAPWPFIAMTGAAIIAGWGAINAVRSGRLAGWNWLGAAVGGLVLAGSVSLVASERWPTYRTIWALAIVVLVLVVRPLEDLRPAWRRMVLVGLMVLGAATANWNVRRLFVEPQQLELAAIERAAVEVARFDSPRVLLVLQPATVSQAPLRWLDEFGSNSSDCEWSPKEMLRMALRAQGDRGRVVERGLRLKSALQSPPDSAGFDVVIDLRIGGTVAVKK